MTRRLIRLTAPAEPRQRWTLRRPSPATDDGESLVPLINVVFLLMVFFLLAGSISPSDEVSVSPPESASERSRSAPAPQLLVFGDGHLQLEGKAIRLADLPALGLSRVEILADAQMDVGQLKRVLAQLQGGGVSEISLLTRRP